MQNNAKVKQKIATKPNDYPTVLFSLMDETVDGLVVPRAMVTSIPG